MIDVDQAIDQSCQEASAAAADLRERLQRQLDARELQ
tara:strand:- start:493 stop:603 length:111 start_codon:yes stop_codon:yes gene_type:complete